MKRANFIPIDPRSHLEVADRKHRYAKNLRAYFKEYHRLNGSAEIAEAQPSSSSGAVTPSRKWARYDPFFQWLDNENNLPELEECPRNVLDEDRVEYLTTEEERHQYEITFGDGLWRQAATGELVNTGPKGWIFVLMYERMYACEKRTNSFPRFHHSSFFAGSGVNAAGMIVCVEGRLAKLFPHSGHYRPHDRHLYSLLAYLRDRGVQLRGVQVDVQRVMKLSRQVEKDGNKAKKADCALYMDAETAYNFLRSKTAFQEAGILSQINRLRYEEPDPVLPNAAVGTGQLPPTIPTTSLGPSALASASDEGSYRGGEGGGGAQVHTLVQARALSPPSSGERKRRESEGQGSDHHHSNSSSSGAGGGTVVGTGVEGSSHTAGRSPRVSTRAMAALSANDGDSDKDQEDPDSGWEKVSAPGTAGGSPLSRTHGTGGSQQHSPSQSVSQPSSAPTTGISERRYLMTPAGDPLNTTSSTVSSANSPFYSPTAQYQYPGYGAGGGTVAGPNAGGSHRRSSSGISVDYASRLGQGIRTATPTNDTLHLIEGAEGEIAAECELFAPTASPARGSAGGAGSATEARARMLGSLLYSSGRGQGSSGTEAATGMGGSEGRSRSGSGVAPTTTLTRVNSRNNTALKAGSPPAHTHSQQPSGTSSKYLAVPALAPLKKVTSHSSICSSLGSGGFLHQHSFSSGPGRSRSQSRVDEHDFAYDLRALLADSPSVVAARNTPSTAGAHSQSQGQGRVGHLRSGSLDTCPSPLTANNSAATSHCNSRTRSRCSSFNAPHGPAGSSSHYPITETSLLSRLPAPHLSNAVNTALDSNGTPRLLQRTFSGSVGHKSGSPLGSSEPSPSSKPLPPAEVTGPFNRAAPAWSSQVGAPLCWDTFTPSTSVGDPFSFEDAAGGGLDPLEAYQAGYYGAGEDTLDRLWRHGVAEGEGGEEGGYGGGYGDGYERHSKSGSSTPSFASSLSSDGSVTRRSELLMSDPAESGAADADAGALWE